MDELTIKTRKKREIADITDTINNLLKDKDKGVINIFVTHTTAAITTADLDPGTDLDMLDAFEEIVPHLKYRHPHDPEHAPDHILSSLIGTSTTIPVKDGEMILGTWQRVVLVELDGPRDRKIMITFLAP